jgi:asparagine synthase (glutamine-hydrolysing)
MHTKRFENYILNTAYGYSIPYIQGIICELLIKEEKVNRDCVIISGNSGDVIEGDQFSPHFTRGNTYSIDSIIDSIIDKHYKVFGEDYSKDSLLREVVKENIEQKSVYTYEEAQDIYENFNWRERQSKYVVNDVRSYDCYLNNEWRLPLWDNELVDFWLKVPIEYRANRKLYYYCIKEEKLPTANNKSTYDKINSFLKRKSSGLVKALYPFRKTLEYFADTTQFYGVTFFEFIKIILKTKGYRTNTITTRVHWLLRRFYDIK